jgi:hypothetical protein
MKGGLLIAIFQSVVIDRGLCLVAFVLQKQAVLHAI